MSVVNNRTGNTALQGGTFSPVRVATTGSNITLSGLQTIDGVALIDGDRVLVKDQTDARTNGIYAAQSGLWLRTTDAISNVQFFSGMAVTAALGVINASQTFLCTCPDDPVVVGTSLITFATQNVLANQAVTATSTSSVSIDTAFASGLASNGTVMQGQGLAPPLFTAAPQLGVAGSTQGSLALCGVTTGVVTVATQPAAGTWTFKWPTGPGTNGYVLTTDGTGIASWAPAVPTTRQVTGAGLATGGGALSIDQVITVTASSEAQAEAGVNTATAMTPQAAAQAIIALTQNFKNVAGRNGGFEVWTRGTPVSVAASTTAYTVDGWFLATGIGQASTVTQASGLTNGSVFAAKVQRTAGQTGTGNMVFAFPLDTDELAKIKGNAVVLSFTVKAGANFSPTSGTLSYLLACGTGSPAKRVLASYTGETLPINTSVNLTPGGASVRVVSPISAAVATNIAQAEVAFIWTPTGTAGADDSFTIDDVQLEVVPAGIAAVTPQFERSDLIWDVARCQRFLPSVNPGGSVLTSFIAIGQANSTASANFIIAFSVPARARPTGIEVSASGDFQITNAAGAGTACNSSAYTGATTTSSGVQFGVATTPLIAGNASQLFFSGNANASLRFTGAEI